MTDLTSFNTLTGMTLSEDDVYYVNRETQEILTEAPTEIGSYEACLQFTCVDHTFYAGGENKTIKLNVPFVIKVAVHDHTWMFDGIEWTSAANAVGFTAKANYHCTVAGCGETSSVNAPITPDALPTAKCTENQTVTLTAAVAAGDSPDLTAHSDEKDVEVAAPGSHNFDESIEANVNTVPATCLDRCVLKKLIDIFCKLIRLLAGSFGRIC